ncbi:hypothetical protein [Methylophaga sp.]|uniref:hypothetical protein n=1 Tax=Methylophaga sp. TaxID=2024840 RepID=UPI0027213ABD|nr:hypothetical protein [Methylophaga sp.]MDO8826157.1 hypothetical protein [Methylophaga sp.]
MTKPQSLFHYLLIGFFMISMLMPAAHAGNNDMPVHHEMSQQQHDCHSNTEAQHKHDASSHCASDNCQCATANCHASVVLGFQPIFMASLYSQSRLAITAEQLVSQNPPQFERPPRS